MQASHIQALENCLASVPRMVLPIETGDVVILDNRRMLHGRRAIRAGSARHLFRAWMNCSDKYKGLINTLQDENARQTLEAY